MKRARFSEEQIIGILKAAEAAGNVRGVCREHNITEQTFYRWRRKYGGMEISEAKKLRALEQENSELKKVVAELSLDNRLLKELNSKEWRAWRIGVAERSTWRARARSVSVGLAG